MEEEINKPEETTPSGNNDNIKMKLGVRLLGKGLWSFLKEHLSIRTGTDVTGTIEGIKKDIDFKGHAVWILICSIFIASIGLNINSTAVIIGAMLISPLMGPILGIGLAVGTNDHITLKRALINFAVMVGISLLSSYFYFLFSPLGEVHAEILSRTKPTLLDAFVGIFGGMAGIIAGSRKEKSNVIPGVAIATALMPPLCTAGFGLAIGNFSYFFGAMYLFLLNSVFISIATVVTLKFLRFPQVTLIDQSASKKINRSLILFVILIVVPSGWLFIDVVKESIFKTKANSFVSENFNFPGTQIVSTKFNFTDSIHSIELIAMGDILQDNVIKNLEKNLGTHNLENTKLIIHQSKDATDDIAGKLKSQVKEGILEELFEKNIKTIADKDAYIADLEKEIYFLQQNNIPFEQIANEAKINYDAIEKIAFANSVESNNTGKLDTIPTFILKWKADPTSKTKKKLKSWLLTRLDLDTVRIIQP